MAEAIIAPYTEASQVLSTEKKEVFTLSNFILSASYNGSYTPNYVTNGTSNYSANLMRIFAYPEYYQPTSVNKSNPTSFIQSFAPILCSSLCDVSRCVITISIEYVSHSNLISKDGLPVLIGVGWNTEDLRNTSSFNPTLSSGNTSTWTYGTFTFTNNALSSNTKISAEYDLVSSNSYVGISQNVWRNVNPSNVMMVIVSSLKGNIPNISNSVWSSSSVSLSLRVNATCTIIYTDYR